MMMRQGPNNNNKNRGPRRGGNPQHGGGNGGGNRRPQGPNRNQNFDSNGPDVRIRGSAYQVFEKYLNLARDATAAGDRVMAESYYQHAEHYHRIINIIEFGEDGQRRPRQESYNNNGQNQAGFGGDQNQGDQQQGDEQQFGNNGNEGSQYNQPPAEVTGPNGIGSGPQPYINAAQPQGQDNQDQPAVHQPQRRDYNESKTEEPFDVVPQPE